MGLPALGPCFIFHCFVLLKEQICKENSMTVLTPYELFLLQLGTAENAEVTFDLECFCTLFLCDHTPLLTGRLTENILHMFFSLVLREKYPRSDILHTHIHKIHSDFPFVKYRKYN